MGWGCGRIVLTISAVLHVATGQASQPQVQSVRLIGGNATAGRVEVQIGGTFGTVCDDQWDDKDATVVCRQLNHTGGTALQKAAYGAGTGPILLDDVDCKGEEKTLNGCYFTTGNAINCGHSEDASVVCQPAGSQTTPPSVPSTTRSGVTQPDNCVAGSNPQSTVRLYGPQNQPGVGYVQVHNGNGTYGFVCDDGWDINAAKVVCNELCFNRSVTESGMKKEFQVSVATPVLFALDDVECVGNEAFLRNCNHAPWFVHNCDDTELAAVTCVEVTYPTPTPPSPNLQCRNGDLIALFSKSRDPNLEAKHLSLPVDCPALSKDESDPDYITVTIPFDDCGTNVTQNETHIIYTNTLFMESTTIEGAISRVNEYTIELTCEMPRNATVDTNVKPLTETITQRAEGEFVVTMTIYEDRGFSQPAAVYPYELTLGEWLNTAVELESIDSRLKLVVTDCIASPNLNDSSAPTVTLLREKCVADRSTLEIYPQSKVKMGYRLQSFIFVNYPIVVLQCEAIVCLTSEVTSECDRTCNNTKPAPAYGGTGNRRRRDVSDPVAGTGNRERRDVSGSGAGTGASKTVYTVRSPPVVVVVQSLTSPSARPRSTSTFSTNYTTTTTTTASTTSAKAVTTSTTTTTTTSNSALNSPNSTTATTRKPPSTTTTRKPAATTTTSSTAATESANATTTTTTTTPSTTAKGQTSSLPPSVSGREGVTTTQPTHAPIVITVRGTGPTVTPTSASAAKGTSLVPATPGTTMTLGVLERTVTDEGTGGASPRSSPSSVVFCLAVLVVSFCCLRFASSF